MEHRPAEPLAAEQVSRGTPTLDKNSIAPTDPFRSVTVACFALSDTVGSSNTSKYFGSVDSLEHDHKAKAKAKTRGEGGSEGGQSQSKASTQAEGEHFIKYVLQEPLWLLMANTDDKVMMTYQMPPR